MVDHIPHMQIAHVCHYCCLLIFRTKPACRCDLCAFLKLAAPGSLSQFRSAHSRLRWQIPRLDVEGVAPGTTARTNPTPCQSSDAGYRGIGNHSNGQPVSYRCLCGGVLAHELPRTLNSAEGQLAHLPYSHSHPPCWSHIKRSLPWREREGQKTTSGFN